MNQQEHLIRQIGAMVLEISRLAAEVDMLAEKLKAADAPKPATEAT